jgi:hypothetical protein
MSIELGPPSAELARRILATAPYAQRLRVGRLTPPVGLLASNVRSLHELCLHLEPDLRSLPGVNLSGVASWLATTIGDDELAAAVTAIDGAQASYVEKCERLFELVRTRLAQAQQALGEEPEGRGALAAPASRAPAGEGSR